jgi:hypothetical protein
MSKVDRTAVASLGKEMQPKANCNQNDCTKTVRARGMCNGHWIKWRRANPDAPTLESNPLDYSLLTSNDIEKFWSKVDKTQECWTRGTGTGWYATFTVRGQMYLGHRVAYYATTGSIPDGLVILHSCDYRPCVKPTHLRAGTKADNVLDMIQKGRNWQASVTHCPEGHEYDDENSRYTPAGGLYCRTCFNARSLARYYARRHGAAGR